MNPYLVLALAVFGVIAIIVIMAWLVRTRLITNSHIDFRIHSGALIEWVRLCHRWGVAEALRWFSALVEHIRAHDGIPPEAVPDTRSDPVIYWLLFGEVGVEYTIQVRRGQPRRVIFIGFDLPSYPAIPSPLPD